MGKKRSKSIILFDDLPFFGNSLDRMADNMFGEGGMCGHCTMTELGKRHDPNKHKRWRCQLCGTDWFGIEPGNDRRGAIMAQRVRKK